MSTPIAANPKPRPARGFVVFKWTVYALLAVDVALYAAVGRATELLDTVAWTVLLILFEVETGGWRISGASRRALRTIRLVAAIAVAAAAVGYAVEREWLDFVNAATWIGVVALLETQLRLPRSSAVQWWLCRGAWILYALLASFALVWTAQGVSGDDAPDAWLDAIDATLWLVAFAAIELNLLGLPRTVVARP